jgi:hypothetical protein
VTKKLEVNTSNPVVTISRLEKKASPTDRQIRNLNSAKSELKFKSCINKSVDGINDLSKSTTSNVLDKKDKDKK